MTNVKKLITEHLDIWLTAETEKKSGRGRSSGSSNSIYGVQKLRELILDLAIRGKLLPQNIKDEPVSLLIEKITDEKNQKVLVGEIKKQKSLPTITAPFPIPGNWQWLYLQDLSSYIQRGKSPKYVDKSDKIVISQKCVRWNGLDISPARFIDPKSLENYEPVRFLKDGDILWNSTGTGTIGRASLFFQINDYQAIVADSHVTVVRTLGNISDYIYLVIRSPYIQTDLESSATGTTNQIELNTSTVLQTKIPLPPIEEQKRIVAKVDELMQLCDQLEDKQSLSSDAHDQLVDTLLNVLTNSSDADEFQQNWQRISEIFDLLFTTEYSIEQLKQTILQLAVMGKLVKQDSNDEPASELLKQIAEEKAKLVKEGKIKKSKFLLEITNEEKPFELSDNAYWVRLEQLLPIFQNGNSSRGDNNGISVAVLRLADITNNKIDLSDLRYLIIDENAINKYQLIKNDILITRVNGSSDIVGSFTFCSDDIGAIYCDHFIRMRLNQSWIDSEYLSIISKSKFIRSQIESLFVTTAGQKTVNQKHIGSILMPLFPKNRQIKIVKKVSELFSIIENFQTLQSKLQKIKLHLANSLVANALSDSDEKSESKASDSIIQFEKKIEAVKQSNQKSADQIDLFTDESVEDDLKLLSLAAEITFQLHTEPTFGHLKLQKLIYLCQQLKHMDLAADFKQHAAGPYDPVMACYLDKEFKDREWFSYDPKRDLKYKPLSRCNDHRSAFNKYFAKDVSEIYDLIGLFRTSKSDHIEIVATLFACWLRLLEKKLSVTEEQLLKDFYAWSEEKNRFGKAEVLNGYKWMKQNSIVPL
ncbi:restriction endonuclease subunit S [Acinetobacter suaedae]|uniref:Restriction endonuclease subunit S n=1 Tax=Acinetobacter suaedae TaxID=2609668 RepID=A0A5P1UU79_9GAMM|nr:restriction endonuclease subunit S [Acinetobacter sp. C16S1]QER40411.1 restriction endonuclease subunit S [Acinetobacter sp. C16S1]